jgi:hypothetical protein
LNPDLYNHVDIPMRPKPFAARIVLALMFSSTLWAAPPTPLTITNFTRSGETSVISWTAETNSFTNVFFDVLRSTNLGSSFTLLTNVSENSPLVYTDSVSAEAAFYRIAQSNAFTPLTQPGAFTAFDAGSTSGLNTKGYLGAMFDGRYVYFVPYYNGAYHGRVLRYDTQTGFQSAPSWSAFDAGNIDGLSTVGYVGGVFDGRYIYFAPNFNGAARHGTVLRYDTQGAFSTSSSWQAYDAGSTSGLNTRGYRGAVFDGRYVYFVPNNNGVYHGLVLRYDTLVSFTNASSWSAFDAGSTDGLLTRGYVGGVFDGRYIYFVPSYNGTANSGIVLRYDTQLGFTNASSWHAYDAGNTSGLNTKGYCGAVFDGRYVYFVPYYNGVSFHGLVLRYDTQGSFSNGPSWLVFDAGNTDGLQARVYCGGVFDGRYICFVPSSFETGHGIVLRYDTQTAFTTSSSWHAYDAGNTSGLNTKGFTGAVMDGRYIYFAPFINGTEYSGNVLRFDAKLPRAVPATVKGGSNF